ncbi:sel1 repeat family protein [Pseudomonas sp. ADAK18]|uniref:tetratricopeptide repeat protein n=1 Tax=Pseudomonas sp. ADAK18 TaxID=2730848 RepID=UPI0014632D1B|nr:tetratricopeptide repeat protein [Pseudomonas sp. ADAK18]QJI30070.1 sel1 repeat family protein [Pseudomonas sp. ADAK18]
MKPEPVTKIKAKFNKLAMAACGVLYLSVGNAATIEDARAAYTRDDYATAFSLASTLAKQNNDPAARNMLAGLLLTGKGRARDVAAALKIWTDLARQDYAPAQATLGALYLDGSAIGAADYKKAKHYLELSVAHDNPTSIYNLGFMYELGLGVPKSISQAIGYYEQSAKLNYAKALFRLGSLSANHLTPEGGPESACQYYERAAKAGYGEGAFLTGKCFATGVGMPKNLPLASQWYREAAMLDVPQAQANLGYIFEKGLGQEVNIPEAYKWYWLASARVPEAAKRVGIIETEMPSIRDSANEQTKAAWRQEIQTFIKDDNNRRGLLINK